MGEKPHPSACRRVFRNAVGNLPPRLLKRAADTRTTKLRVLQQRVHYSDQVCVQFILVEEAGNPCHPTFLTSFGTAGDHQDRQRGGARPQLTHEGRAIHYGHGMIAHDQSGAVGIEILEGFPAVGVGGDLRLWECFPEQMHNDKAQLVVVLGDKEGQRGRAAGNGAGEMHVRSDDWVAGQTIQQQSLFRVARTPAKGRTERGRLSAISAVVETLQRQASQGRTRTSGAFSGCGRIKHDKIWRYEVPRQRLRRRIERD